LQVVGADLAAAGQHHQQRHDRAEHGQGQERAVDGVESGQPHRPGAERDQPAHGEGGADQCGQCLVRAQHRQHGAAVDARRQRGQENDQVRRDRRPHEHPRAEAHRGQQHHGHQRVEPEESAGRRGARQQRDIDEDAGVAAGLPRSPAAELVA
jgi:hypothetical protein